MKRVLTALALFPLAFYGTFWAPYWGFFTIVASVALLCFYEYSGIVAGHGIERPGPLSYAAGLLLLFNPSPVVLVGVALLTVALRLDNLARVLPSAGAALLGIVYVFGAWRACIDLHAISPYWLLYALAINWVGDIAAYYTGRAFGKHRLAPVVSPKKSWEGAAGSIVATILFGLFYRRWLGIGIPEVVMLSIVGNIAGQLGDLAESAMKRGAGVKDSGTLLPGHGGWLDRLDSSLFSMPVIYWLHHALQLR
jgi:phosphatidate cytidylyltransferase